MLVIYFFFVGRLAEVDNRENKITGEDRTGTGANFSILLPAFAILALPPKGWPANGLHLTSVVLEGVASFRNPSLIMTIQPHPQGLTAQSNVCQSQK